MSDERPIGERMATAEAMLQNMKAWVIEINANVKMHEAALNRARGGWFMLCLLCGGSGAIGALIVKFFNVASK